MFSETTLIHGYKGAFEVKLNGELIYSKKSLGRHAEEGEVLKLVAEKLGPDVETYPKK